MEQTTESATPSVDEMIADSVSADEPTDATTTLDDTVLLFESDDDRETDSGSDDSGIVVSDSAPRKRGRPRGTSDNNPRAKKKAELAADVERLQNELNAMRARNDDNAVAQLATSIEMATFLAFGYAAEVRGPHWAATEKEAHDIGQAGAHAMAPYAQQMSQQLPWMVFAGVIGKAIYSRVQIDRAMTRQLPDA